MRSTESETLSCFASSSESAVLTEADADILKATL